MTMRRDGLTHYGWERLAQGLDVSFLSLDLSQTLKLDLTTGYLTIGLAVPYGGAAMDIPPEFQQILIDVCTKNLARMEAKCASSGGIDSPTG